MTLRMGLGGRNGGPGSPEAGVYPRYTGAPITPEEDRIYEIAKMEALLGLKTWPKGVVPHPGEEERIYTDEWKQGRENFKTAHEASLVPPGKEWKHGVKGPVPIWIIRTMVPPHPWWAYRFITQVLIPKYDSDPEATTPQAIEGRQVMKAAETIIGLGKKKARMSFGSGRSAVKTFQLKSGRVEFKDGKWSHPTGKEVESASPAIAYLYAKNVKKGPWKAGEGIIEQGPNAWAAYEAFAYPHSKPEKGSGEEGPKEIEYKKTATSSLVYGVAAVGIIAAAFMVFKD